MYCQFSFGIAIDTVVNTASTISIDFKSIEALLASVMAVDQLKGALKHHPTPWLSVTKPSF